MNYSSVGYVFKGDFRGETQAVVSSFTKRRTRVFWFFFFGLFVTLSARLFWLQIIHGSRNRSLSEENRILARRIQAPRGVILDRNGEPLVQNIPVYRIENPDCRPGNDQGVDEFSQDQQCSEFIEISRDEALRLEAEGRESEIFTLVGRRYVYGPEMAHVTGYVGEIDAEEFADQVEYDLGDLTGKMGVERYYEDLLHGRNGAELVEVDVSSAIGREVAKKEPVSGGDLRLTLNARLQQSAYELMAGRTGALIALDPRNGEVLALVSNPSFDPNEVAASLALEGEPFFNRAVAGLYPPGSVFKVVTAVAGLEDGKINESTEIEDTGEIRIGPYRYGNWYFDQYGRTEGVLGLVRAIKRSNDIFFYKVGEFVGATRLSEWAKAFGFGRPTGIDLPGETDGLVPSPLWKERERGERWFLGNTYHLAIGQSDLQVTPLQVARMTGVVASGGKLCRPHVLLGDGRQTEDCEEVKLQEQSLRLVREGMVEACRSGGTAFPFFDFGVNQGGEFRRIEVGCKTGTAEYGDPQDRTHAWFTVYGPAEDPQIVVTVLLEGAGEGSYEAAPVAKGFLSVYFSEVSRGE